MAEPIRVREISNEEGNRLLRAVRRSSGSVVTWRRSQMILLSAQGMDPGQIARVTFTSPDRVRDVIRNVRSLHPLETRIAIVLDNFSPHLTTKLDQRVGEFAAANNIEL